jgi:serine/threonine protein kinase
MTSIPANSAGLRPRPDGDGEQRLNEVIAAYLEDLEAGRSPDRSGLLGRHPDLAADLASFFANEDHLDRLTAPFRDPRSPGDSSRGVHRADPFDPDDLTPSVVPFPVAGRARVARPIDSTVPAGDAADDPGARARSIRYFGDYELMEIIAEGGMGVVYKARQVSLDRVLALKMVRAGRFATPDDLQRFRLEAEAAAHLDHPHIVPIHEIGEYEGHHYFSMKLVDGGSLASHAARYAEDPRAVAKLMATVARAVHYAHQRGILHRDLKPANILLSGRAELPLDQWIPLVTDFGLAKRVGGPIAAGLTQSGSLVGTPGYMAPEQTEGTREAITTAVDVHALGVILFELLTGRPPFRAETMLETLRLVREQEPARPRSLNPRVPRDLATIALKCLNKAPSRRYRSAEALAEDLERWLAHVPILARPSTVPEHLVKWARRRPWVAALMVVGVMAIATSALAVRGLISSARLRTALNETREHKLWMEEEQYFNGVLAAEQALASHNPDQAGRLLEECPPRLRNWEWRHLMRRLHSELRVLQGHSGFLCGLDFAPSSRTESLCRADVLPGSIWAPSPYAAQPFLPGLAKDSSPKPAEYRLHGPDGSAYGLTFDRPGICVATAGADGVVKVWNVVTGQMTHLFRGHDGWATGVSFSPDGARLASAGKDGMIRLWDVRPDVDGDQGRPLKTLTGHDGMVFGVAFSPAGCGSPPAPRRTPAWSSEVISARSSAWRSTRTEIASPPAAPTEKSGSGISRPAVCGRHSTERRAASMRWHSAQTARSSPSGASTAPLSCGTSRLTSPSLIIPGTRNRCCTSGSAPMGKSSPRPARMRRSSSGTPDRSRACASSGSSRFDRRPDRARGGSGAWPSHHRGTSWPRRVPIRPSPCGIPPRAG